MKRILFSIALLVSFVARSQTAPVSVNTGTRLIAYPTNFFSVNAAGVSNAINAVSASGSYSNPSWLTTIGWSKVTGTPTTRSGYGITDAQPLDSELTALAGLTSAADSLPYFTGSGTASLTTLSPFIRTLLDDSDAATARTTLGVGSGSGSVTTVSVTTANGVSGSVANPTTTPAITLSLGDITPTSIENRNGTSGTSIKVFKTYTSGSNYEGLQIDGGVKTAGEFSISTIVGASGTQRPLSIYGGNGLWLQSDAGNVTLNSASSIVLRTASSTRWNIGANIVPNSALTGTIGASGTEVASVFSGTASLVSGGAANASPFTVTGSWYTGGTASTTKPQLLIEPTSTTSTGWSTSGTGLGVNAASGFAGNIIDAQVAGVSKAKVSAAGDLTAGKYNGVTVTAGTGTPALTVNGTSAISGTNTGDQQIGGSTGLRFYEEFCWNSSTSGGQGWLVTSSGGAWSMAASSDANEPGILQASTSTSASANPNLIDNQSAMFLGGGPLVMEWRVKLPTAIPDGTEDYKIWMGLGDTTTGPNQTDGVVIHLDRSVSTTNWLLQTAKAGTRTITDTGIAADGSGSWHKFRFQVDASATQVIAYIDGTACATNSANIPNTSANLCGKMFGMVKLAGTTARTAQIGYVMLSADWTTPR